MFDFIVGKIILVYCWVTIYYDNNVSKYIPSFLVKLHSEFVLLIGDFWRTLWRFLVWHNPEFWRHLPRSQIFLHILYLRFFKNRLLNFFFMLTLNFFYIFFFYSLPAILRVFKPLIVTIVLWGIFFMFFSSYSWEFVMPLPLRLCIYIWFYLSYCVIMNAIHYNVSLVLSLKGYLRISSIIVIIILSNFLCYFLIIFRIFHFM